MLIDLDYLERLEKIETRPWSGTAYRHMFGSHEPDRINTTGARWNPDGLGAIYCSLSESGALAEADYYIGLQPIPPACSRTLYTVEVVLEKVACATDWLLLEEAGIKQATFSTMNYLPTQRFGLGLSRLGCDGFLIPSARSDATNLVILPDTQGANYQFRVSNKVPVA